MNDSYRVYTKVKKMLKHMTKLDRQGQVVTLAMIDRGDRRDKSLFRLGLDWLTYALKHSLDFQPAFLFRLPEVPNHVR